MSARSTEVSESGRRRRRLLAWANDRAGRLFDRLLPPESSRRRWTERVSTGLFVAAILIGVGWVIPTLEARARDLDEPRLARERGASAGGPEIAWSDDVSWLPETERTRVEVAIASELVGVGPFDREALSHAAAAGDRSGWFTAAVHLRRTGLAEVLVETPLRRPAAAVRSGDRDLLVDADGVLLPMTWPIAHTPEELVVLTGIRDEPPSAPGKIWQSGALVEGLATLAEIRGRAWSREVASIDLEQVPGGGPVTLLTRGHGRVIWGTRGEGRVGEVPVGTRLAYLDRLHATSGSIEPPNGRLWDVRFDYLAATRLNLVTAECGR